MCNKQPARRETQVFWLENLDASPQNNRQSIRGKTFKLSCLAQKAKMFHFQFKGHFSLWPKLALLKESWWKHFIMYLCLSHTSVSIPAFLCSPESSRRQEQRSFTLVLWVPSGTKDYSYRRHSWKSRLISFLRSTDLLLFSLNRYS